MMAILFTWAACVSGGSCYDYHTQTIHIDIDTVTPYVLAHEVGHHAYFNEMTAQQRRDQAIGDDVRDEEAWADVYASCHLGRGPKWMLVNGYNVSIGPSRFKRICRFIRAKGI
jgi:hypothetical protein